MSKYVWFAKKKKRKKEKERYRLALVCMDYLGERESQIVLCLHGNWLGQRK